MMALKSTAMFSKDTYRNHADDKGEGVLTEGGQGETLVLLLQLNAGCERDTHRVTDERGNAELYGTPFRQYD